MSDGLRLMIYDNTDVRTVARKIKEFTPKGLHLIDEAVDRLDLELGLSHSWWAGGWIFRKLRRLDHVRGFDSWEAALKWLTTIEPEKTIAEIQFWGHGSPGKVWINGQVMHHRSYVGALYGPRLKQIKARLTDESLIWFRTCATFCGERGQRFARAWADNMGCTIAAHTYNIGLFQAGLHTIRPGEDPRWQMVEGIEEGRVGSPKSIKMSMPWHPNSIFCLQSTIPDELL